MKKTKLQRIKNGLILGWKTPTLPESVLKFQLYVPIRILRVLGGISTIYLLSNKGSEYNTFFLYLALFFSIIFFIYHIIISVIRIKHIYKTLKSDKLDIRNSPLDHMARLSSRLILCAKGLCDQAQPVGIAMGIMLGIDTALEQADQKAIFGPLIGSALKTVLPNNEVKQKTSDLIKKPISEIDENNKQLTELKNIVESVSKWSNSDDNMKKDASEIITEVNKHQNEILKKNSMLRNEITKLLKSDPFNKK